MTDLTYRLNLNEPMTGQELRRVLVLRDSEWSTESTSVNPGMQPEDYLTLLATWLEEVSQRLDTAQPAEAAKLQRVIDDLLYIRDHYALYRKHK